MNALREAPRYIRPGVIDPPPLCSRCAAHRRAPRRLLHPYKYILRQLGWKFDNLCQSLVVAKTRFPHLTHRRPEIETLCTIVPTPHIVDPSTRILYFAVWSNRYRNPLFYHIHPLRIRPCRAGCAFPARDKNYVIDAQNDIEKTPQQRDRRGIQKNLFNRNVWKGKHRSMMYQHWHTEHAPKVAVWSMGSCSPSWGSRPVTCNTSEARNL